MPAPFPHAVIFDWDNTLVDNWGSIADSMNATFRAFDKETWTLEEVKQRAYRSLQDSFPEWFGDDWEKARDYYRDHFAVIHLENVKIMPGAEELIKYLHAQKVPLFVVSNKRGDFLRQEAKHLKWDSYFIELVGSLDAKRDKPDRDPVDLVLGRAGMNADDPAIWFVGDTHIDIQCARNSGCTPVYIGHAEEGKKLEVELVFSDCHGLRSLLYNKAQKEKSP